MTEITGKDLIDRGFEPGPWFGELLREANERNLSLSQALKLAQSRVDAAKAAEDERRAREMPLRGMPGAYNLNITVENEGEDANVAAVKATFDELMRTPTLEQGAVMPDACPAGPLGTIPVGGVVAARNAIHPGMHSADICCSMTATIIDGVSPAELLDAIHSVTHFGPGGRSRHEETPLPKALQEAFAENPYLADKKLQGRARSDFTTCGDGNHFNYVGISEATGKTVLVSHFGSRGPGALLYKAGMIVAEKFREALSPETLKGNAWIPLDTPEGRDYWAALQIIREWTKQSHAHLHDAALAALGGRASVADRLWNEHNFCFKEDDAEGSLIWHAKGATPIHNDLIPDTAGTQIIPLNMTQPILFVQGQRNATNIGFAPHGAGRNLSRSAHKRLQQGRSDEEIFAEETQGIDARFFCGKIDISELPSAYKDADRVQADMKAFGLADVVDRVLPYGAIMAGDWEQDAPWRKKAKAKAEERNGTE